MRGQFSEDQVRALLRPIKPHRIYEANGQSHVAGWEIKAHLTRLFGFGAYKQDIVSLDLVAEDSFDTGKVDKNDRPLIRWWVTYRAVIGLTVHDQNGLPAYEAEEVATGTAENQPKRGEAHDLAAKEAVTQGLKRCCVGLGDQFGLSLYDKGNTRAVVGMTLVHGLGTEPDVSVTGEGDPERPFTEGD